MPLAAFPKCFLDELVVYKTMTVEEWIDRAADELDVDGLEFYWGFTPHYDIAALQRLKERLAEHGLAMPMMCFSPDFTQPTPAERGKEIEKQRHAIEATAHLGGKYCRVLSGQRRPGLSIEEGVEIAAGCINACLPHAEEWGITLVLENHYKDGYWQFPEFAQKREVFLQLLAAIPHTPWFGVNYDPSNALIAGEDPLVLLNDVKERVVTMHASDRYFEGGTAEDLRKLGPREGYASILKHGIVGRGLNNYDAIFSTLKSVGFNGWISIEDGIDARDGMEHLQLSAEFLRAKMKQHGLE
jgi:sugar phosphate isomerase/epimerase